MWPFRRRTEDDFRREIEAHLAIEAERLVAEGLGPEEARQAAARRFGNVASVQERFYESGRILWLNQLQQDVRYAARSLRRSPVFAIAAILTLGIGIGANTAMFSLVDAVLLRSLPVERPQELVFLQSAGSEGPSGAPPYPCFERFRNETSSFAGMAAFAADELRVEVDGQVEQVFGQVASGSYFDVLGLRPVIGRLMTIDDEHLNPPVAVIGYHYWHRRFGGDLSVIGRTIAFRNETFTIVGVTPSGFWGLHPGRRVDVTLPITLARTMIANPDRGWFDIIARVQPATTVGGATAQVDTIYKSFMQDRDVSEEMRRTRFERMILTPAAQGLPGLRSRFSTPLYVLTAAAALVLLIACVNLGNLLLARRAARAREFAIRLAIGASSRRVFRQLVTETVLLFLLGGVAGLVIARVVVDGLTGFFAVGRNPIILDVHYDWRLAAFAGGVALATGLITGLWPALRAVRIDPQVAAKDADGRLAGSPRASAIARLLVAGQVALSVILLVSAMMFVRTMSNLRAVDLGFRGTGVLTMSLIPEFVDETARERRTQFWTGVLDRVRDLPGVRAASLSVLTPLSGRDTGQSVAAPGFEPQSDSDRMVRLNHVSDDYFQTFDIDLSAGRAFTPRDREGALRVAILNEASARFYFADRSPIGETMQIGESTVYRIIGVVRDHKHRTLREESPRFVFVPLWQPLDPISRITLAASSDQPSAALARAVADEVRALHSNTLISDIIGVEEQIDATLLTERLLSVLATGFAALAVGLAAIGLYGVLSYSVAWRRTELGIRIALGASRTRIAGGVFREVLLQIALGIMIGLPVALTAAGTVEGLLFGVRAADPGTYLLSVAVVTIVACLAAWIPARRASLQDPAELLRHG